MSMPALFSPLTLRGLILRNRLVLSPMCQYAAVEGVVQDWHHQHHARFASGGIALGFVEATGVTRRGRITHGCTGLWNDDQVPGLHRIAELYHAYGAACGIQLGHAGRRASAERPWDGAAPIQRADGPEGAWERVAPSAIPEREGYPAPRALTEAEIEELIGAFAAAARRALAAGFDVIEIHGAHGYLVHSFFSPISNQRNDAFGGSREKRMRFPLLVAEAMRAAWPAEKPLFYRTSSIDGVPGGLTMEDTVALARELKARGVDVLDCSSGGMSGPATLSTAKIAPGYQVPYAAEVRAATGLATMAVGAILEPSQAEAILEAGKADLVAIGRQLMAEPHWLYRAGVELGHPEPDRLLAERYGFYLKRRAAVLDVPARAGSSTRARSA
jgi:2,4-dienoyl-CoA reductase-like NADH-dependent reductase (Old Yellow Enzyme family)